MHMEQNYHHTYTPAVHQASAAQRVRPLLLVHQCGVICFHGLHSAAPQVHGAQHCVQHPGHLHGDRPAGVLGWEEDVHPGAACQKQASRISQGLDLLLGAVFEPASWRGERDRRDPHLTTPQTFATFLLIVEITQAE